MHLRDLKPPNIKDVFLKIILKKYIPKPIKVDQTSILFNLPCILFYFLHHFQIFYKVFLGNALMLH